MSLLDDLIPFGRAAWRLVVFRAAPFDMPYAPWLAAAGIALLASIYPAWLGALILARGEAPSGVAALLLAVGVVPTAGLVAVCFLILRAFHLVGRFAQFALAMTVVQGLAMLGLFVPSALLATLVGPEGRQGLLAVVPLVALSALPLFALAWYGLAMSRVWALTLDRGHGLGFLMTLLQNVGLFAAWFIGFAIMGVSSGSPE